MVHRWGRGLVLEERAAAAAGGGGGDDERSGMCFYSAVAAYFCPADATSAQLGKYVEENFSSVVPAVAGQGVTVEQVADFEESNVATHDMAINVVYSDEEEKCVYPVLASKRLRAKNEIVLILFSLRDPDGGGGGGGEEAAGGRVPSQKHYALVREPGLLFACRYKKEAEDGSEEKITRRRWNCWNCFNQQCTAAAHKAHVAFCHENTCQKIRMPRQGQLLSYEEGGSRESLTAYMLFFDFEALSVPPQRVCSCPPDVLAATDIARGLMGEVAREEMAVEQLMLEGEAEEASRRPPRPPKTCGHKMHVMKDQPPFAYNYVLVDREGTVHENRTYVGVDAAEDFAASVMRLVDRYVSAVTPGVPMDALTPEQAEEAAAVKECYLCRCPLSADRHKVRDHDHLTGKFLGYAHSWCNLRRRERISMTCFAHNFSGYDSHFLVRAFRKMPELLARLQAIPLNTQRFKAFCVDRKVWFVDSLAFLSDSLANLTGMLAAGGEEEFRLLDSLAADAEERRLLLRKGVYPYSFATSIRRLRDADSLPPRSEFASELTEEECSAADYEHARAVWEKFRCRNMLEYTILYMRTDVLLLAEIVTSFRKKVWEAFGLDLCQYLSLPHLSLDVMLKETRVALELISDQEQADLIRRNIRGGLSFVNLRRARRIPGRQMLMYFDANALYAHAMTFALPVSGFRWLSAAELGAFDPERDITEDGEWGYILEVDLDYPPHLHLAHNSLPLAPEAMDIREADLSPYSRGCLAALGQKRAARGVRKLTSTFRRRNKYVLHGLNLRLYLRHGLRLLALRRAIVFRQAPFMRGFIGKCAERRRLAATTTEQLVWKLTCNAVYGKLIESAEKRMNAHFNTSEEEVLRKVSSPLFKGIVVCDEDLTITYHRKKEIHLKQSWAVGFSVLEISKYVMQSLFHDVLRARFPAGSMSLVMSDTDSFLLALKASDETEVMEKLSDHMDFSNLPAGHPLRSDVRKKAPGFLKNEVPSSQIVEVVALKSKCYAYSTASGERKNVAKGVAHAAKRKIPLESFAACIDAMQRYEVEQKTIRSKDHVNQVIRTRKVAFSSFDDKRYMTCAVHSVPYGSCLIDLPEFRDKCYFCARPDELH
jgi:hypothetical protein